MWTTPFQAVWSFFKHCCLGFVCRCGVADILAHTALHLHHSSTRCHCMSHPSLLFLLCLLSSSSFSYSSPPIWSPPLLFLLALWRHGIHLCTICQSASMDQIVQVRPWTSIGPVLKTASGVYNFLMNSFNMKLQAWFHIIWSSTNDLLQFDIRHKNPLNMI